MAATDIVFIHQNMPGQFRFLASALARNQGLRVFFVTKRTGVSMPGVRTVLYPAPNSPDRSTEAFARPMEASARYGHAVAQACLKMKGQGVTRR